MSVIDLYADFAASLPHRSVPDVARQEALRCLLDYAGAVVSGADAPPAEILRTSLAPLQGPARLWPDGAPCDPRTAALINATASHTIEVDDIYSPGLYHPGVCVVPAAIAVGEAEGVSGTRLLTAIIAGYEVSNRIAETLNPAHYRFWHTTATVGHFGAAAAAASVLSLDAAQTAHALATTASMAAGLRHAFSSDAMTKPLHAGRAAEAGVLAALGARSGLTGVPDMLEAERGFGTAFSETPDWRTATQDLGQRWTICEMTRKPHACCGHTFPAIDAISDLRASHAFDPEMIRSIEIATYRAAIEICGNREPRTPYEAKFSLPYCAALAAGGRAATPDAFDEAVDDNKERNALMERVKLRESADAEAVFPGKRAAGVRITMTDGRMLEATCPNRRGAPDAPLSDTALEAKFNALAGPVLGAERAGELARCLWHVDQMDDIRALPIG